MDWFEAISENYMDTGGRPVRILEKVRRHYPIALHGTSLSIGSIDPLNPDYLLRLKNLIRRIDPFIVSDHLCWSSVGGEALHDLLPLPFTEEALQHIVNRVQEVQDFIGRPILLENVSTYVTYRHSVMSEWEFLKEVAERSGSGILLDLNNLYVNSFNHQFDPMEYLRNIPGEKVRQLHLAGHTDRGKFLFDTHSDHVIDKVWKLYEEALKLWGAVSTLIEWDEAIPAFEILSEEAEKARKIYNQTKGAVSEIAPASSGLPPCNNKCAATISLSETQHWIRDRIQPWKRNAIKKQKGSDPFKEPDPFLNPQAGDPGEERMEVYASGYLARIGETLNEVYPSIRQVLGPEKFNELSIAYAHHFPSKNYNLNYAGRYLEKFLKSTNEFNEYPFLPDSARLEWSAWEAFHAFDETPVQPEDLTRLVIDDWEKIKIEFQPSVRLVQSEWPIFDIWCDRVKTEAGVDEKNRSPRSQLTLVGRRADQVRCERVDENQYRLLEGLLEGRTLGEVCEALSEILPEDESLPVDLWFSRWIKDGLILNVRKVCSLPGFHLMEQPKPGF